MTAITVSRRVLVSILAAAIALLLAVVILLSALLSTINRAENEAAHRECMSRLGTSTVMTGETLDEYASRSAQAAAFCAR